MGLKVVICGSREFTNYEVLCTAIKLSNFDISEVISGGAKGVDKMGERWAKENNIPVKIFLADWNNLQAKGAVITINKWGKKMNKLAGFQRNSAMVEYADAGIAIDTGSGGTNDTIKKFQEAGKPIFLYNPDDNMTENDFGYVF